MATVVNFIDTTLQAAAARGVNLPTADIQLLPSAPLFKVAPDGSITPPSITFTATLIDLEAVLTFNATGAPLTGVTARSVTVVGESMTGSSVTVIASATVNGRTYTKPCTISKLQDGSVGSTTYTWIKYADSAAGAGLSDDPTGKAYIGLAYNKPSPIESIIASDYTWSLIKGEDGVPGQPGKDGVQLYTWIRYSNSADGAGLYDQPTADTLYIGIAVNRTTATESSNPADYVWSRFKGDQGVPGPALYTWIKYADSAAGAGLSDDPTNKAYIGFAYNKTTAVESENPADYTWSLNQGGQGVPGQPGKDGTTFYTWIKYSDAPDGTGLYDVPTDSTVYIGIAVNKVTATESTNKADYTWSRFKGGQGVPGSPGQPGQRGTIDISAGTAGTVWSDSEATAAIAQTGYGVPQMLDVVTLYNQAAGFANTRYWNGSAWIPVAQVINGSLLVKNTVAADKIDTRGLSIKDAHGNVILAAGSALSKDYAAPGTLNSDIKIGGRNLYKRTLSFADQATGSQFVGRLPTGFQLKGINQNTGEIRLFNAIPGNGEFTISFDLHVSDSDGYPLQIDVCDGASWTINPTRAGGHFEKTFAVTNWSAAVYNFIDFARLSGQFYIFENFKVEVGNKATSWTPAPEDVAADVAVAGTTADFALVYGATKPQDNATVGAPSGTMVAGAAAEVVAANAAAVPAMSQAINKKLQKDGYDVITGQIGLQSKYAILVGDTTNGVWIGNEGLVLVQGGVIKATLPISGNPTFAGQLVAAFGTLGALRIAAGGWIVSGGYDGSWAFPPVGSAPGFLIHPNGILFGNENDPNMGFFQVFADGRVRMPGFSYAGRQLTLDNPVLIAPKLQTTLSVYIPLQQLRNVGGSSVTWSFSPVVSGGSGAVARYLWTFTTRDSASPITMISSPSDSSVTLRATGAGWKYGYISLTIYDTNGAVASTSQDVSVQFGSAVEP